MPIYEYQCQGKCKQLFEYMQSMKDPPKKKCEKCGGKLEKQLSASGFVLKGGGWYKDLYASSKPSSGDSDGGGSAADVTPAKPADKPSTTSTTSESKPEPKAEKKPAASPAKKKSSKGK